MDELLGALHQEGALDSSGRFTVARHAREKLRRFQLLEPQRCMLQFVAAAVAGNASKIELRVLNDDLELKFDGFAPNGAELRGLLDYLFQGESAPAIHRELAVGVNTALVLASEVGIESWEGSQGYRIEFRAVGEELESPGVALAHRPWAGQGKGVRIRLRFKEASSLVDAVAGKTPGRRYLEYVARHCGHSPVPIFGEGRDLRAPLAFRSALGLLRFQVPGLRLPTLQSDPSAVTWEREAGGPCAALLALRTDRGQGVRWVHRGVTLRVDSKTFPDYVEGVIYCDHLRKNISFTDVVEDDVFSAVLTELHEGVRELIWQVVTAEPPRPGATRLAPLVRATVSQFPSERWPTLNAWLLATARADENPLANFEERLTLAPQAVDAYQADRVRRGVLDDLAARACHCWSCRLLVSEELMQLVPRVAGELLHPEQNSSLARLLLLAAVTDRVQLVERLRGFVTKPLLLGLAHALGGRPEEAEAVFGSGLESLDPRERSGCHYGCALASLAREKPEDAHAAFLRAEKDSRSFSDAARAQEGQFYTLPGRSQNSKRLALHRRILGNRRDLTGAARLYYQLEERRLAWLAHDYGTWAYHDLERFQAGWDPEFRFYLKGAEEADPATLEGYVREAAGSLLPGDPWLGARLDMAARQLARLHCWSPLAGLLFRQMARHELLAGR